MCVKYNKGQDRVVLKPNSIKQTLPVEVEMHIFVESRQIEKVNGCRC